MNTLKKIIIALTLSTIGFTFSSNAGLITSWDWEVDTAFTAYGPGAVVADPGSLNHFWDLDGVGTDAPTKLSWGSAANEFGMISSLEIGGSSGHTAGTNLANNSDVLTTSLTHNNFVITGTTLESATLSTRLLLDPHGTGLPWDVTPAALGFDIFFKETLNQETCVVASIIPCRDIFVIDLTTDGGDTTFDILTGSFNQEFMLDGYTYNIRLAVSGLGPLSEAACLAAGAVQPEDEDKSCIGFTTVENLSNMFDVNMRITALTDPEGNKIAEPSSILLMSLALFGIVGGMRKKHN